MSLRDSLSRHLEGQPLIELAVLFGSRARQGGSPASDVDIGLSLAKDEDNRAARRQIEVELGQATKKDVDVVFLDEAPPLLRFEVARDGQLLVERRPYAWADFKAQAMIDWWDWEPIASRVNRYIIQRFREEAADGSS
ncbi:MAG: nucleotidyltransferase domain-containing protein [Acidobacteriota bacterium]